MKYIKLIIITIIDFFLSLFKSPNTKKKASNKRKEVDIKKEEIREKQIINKTDNITTLPDEPKTSNLVNEEISEELKKLFKKYIELITGIKIKDATLEETNEIERIKETILPLISKQIKIGYLVYNSEIEASFIKSITKEIKKKDILPIKKDIEATLIKEEAPLEEKQETKEQANIFNSTIESSQRKGETTKQEHKKTQEEKVVDMRDIKIVYEKKEEKRNEVDTTLITKKEKEVETEEELISIPIVNSIEEVLEKSIEPSINEEELTEEATIKEEQERRQEEKKEETKEDLPKEETQEVKERIKEEIKNEEKEKENAPYFQELLNEVNLKIEELNEELKKEELTIEDYDYIEESIESLERELVTYKILNNLDSKKNALINEKLNKVTDLKKELENTKEQDYKNEKEVQSETMKQEDINRVNSLLEEVYKDNDKDLSSFSLNSIDDLNNKTEEEIKQIEKDLLKLKLRKAAKVVEPSFLLALPFIRNKYFLYFTTGIFLHNHLGIINSLYERKDARFKPVNISPLMKASEALNNSISLTEDNLIKVKDIKNKYVERYPELKYDEDFNKSINKVENKLKSNYEKMVNKENRLNRVKKRSTKINKNIKRKILVKEPKKKDDENKK